MTTRIIYRKCAAQNCLNNNCDNITFFHFPKDKERAIIWAQAAMRNDLVSKAEKLYGSSYRLCAAHFEKNHFLNDLKNRLMPNAIPTIFQSAVQLNQNVPQENIENAVQPIPTIFQSAVQPNQNLPQENIENDTLVCLSNERNKIDQATQTYVINLDNAESQTEDIIQLEEVNRRGFTTRGIQTSAY
ncbi:THAP-type domain-containing protein [Camponotus japonicus]